MKIYLKIILGFLVLFISSCEKEDDIVPQEENPVVVDNMIIDPATNIISDQDTSLISAVDSNTLYISESLLTDTLEINDYLVTGVSDEFPNGFLYRVTDINNVNGGKNILVENAALTDVILNGSIRIEQPLLLSDTIVPRSEFTTTFNLDIVDYDGLDATTNDRVRLSGSQNIDASLIWDVDISWGQLEYAKVGIQMENTTSVKVQAAYSESLSGAGSQGYPYVETEETIISHTFNPTTIFVGAVPVVVAPKFELKAGIEGKIEGYMLAEVSYTNSQSSYLEYYEESGFDAVSTREPDYTVENIDFGIKAGVAYYAKAKLSATVYGAVGLGVDIKPELGINTECSEDTNGCSYDLEGKFKVGLFAEASLLQQNLFTQRVEFTLASQTLASGEFTLPEENLPPTSPEYLTPELGSFYNFGDQLNMSWMSEDPNDDPLDYTLRWGRNVDEMRFVSELGNSTERAFNIFGVFMSDTRIYWQVDVSDGEHEVSGPLSYFHIGDWNGNHYPFEFNITSPINEEIVSLDNDGTFEVSWENAGDPDNDDLTYTVLLAEYDPGTGGPISFVTLIENLEGTSYNIELEENTGYLVGIRAYDGDKYTDGIGGVFSTE